MYEVENDSAVGSLLRKMEHDFVYGTTTVSKYVQYSMYDDLCRIDAYLNSKHTTGLTDSLGREKPFFNISVAASNIWYRATDIDRSKIKILPTESNDVIKAFLYTALLQNWMRRVNFGAFLNEWGRVLARYGSAVLKFVEKDGELIPLVVPWNRLIVDQVDFDENPKIEVLELTEAQLYQREGYDQEMVEKLCQSVRTRTTLDGQTKDNKSGYIKLYEIHGNLPKSYLTRKKADRDVYVQQMHVISCVESDTDSTFDDYTLIRGKEKDPYMITHLIKEDGQTLSIGAVKHLFEAQWMINHSMKAIKDQLDLASKLIFQTSDGSFVGQNALSAIETGDILIHKVNQPLTQLANNSHDITSLQNFGSQWKALSNEITGISESMLGNTAPSGTAWRQVETLLQQNQSLFDLMTENKGLDIERMMRVYVLPFLRKKMNNSDEIVSILEGHDIEWVDSRYIKNMATKKVNETIRNSFLKGKPIGPAMQSTMMQQEQGNVKDTLSQFGNQRFFKPSEIGSSWKSILGDPDDYDIMVDTTGEEIDQNAATTLNTLLTFFAKKQGQPLSPMELVAVTKILNLSGTVSPLELSSATYKTPAPQPVAPQTPPAPQPVT